MEPVTVTAPPPRHAAWAWALAQATRDPYVTLIGIYIFTPYFVARVIGDPVAGQAFVASADKWGGWIVMATAPLLGAMVDRHGPRKPWLAVVTAAMALAVAALWFTPPGGVGLAQTGFALPRGAVFAIIALMAVLISWHDMLHNALLVPAAGMAGVARASGLGLAGANAVTVVMLVTILFAFALPGVVDWAWLPRRPLLGLDPALGEPDRITAPIVAAAMALGVLPLLWLVPDLPRSGLRMAAAFRAGAGDLAQLARDARGHRNPLIFLAARMIYTDGLTAILIFSGLFAAGAMRWGTLELLGYGIILSVAAVVGGLAAGWLDNRIGPKRAIQGELTALIILQTMFLGMAHDRIIFMPFNPVPLWNAPMFRTLPELVFLVIAMGLAICVVSAYASSRTMLTRVAPLEKMGVFFGLYALSGTATMWLGPLLIENATLAGGSQAWGMAPIVGMLAAGRALLALVKGGGR
ncbi:MAG: MFS transporter [Sandarakinorhabdus sp.]|nr:MFS transporter [Sandarakinorhabdus sp.]